MTVITEGAVRHRRSRHDPRDRRAIRQEYMHAAGPGHIEAPVGVNRHPVRQAWMVLPHQCRQVGKHAPFHGQSIRSKRIGVDTRRLRIRHCHIERSAIRRAHDAVRPCQAVIDHADRAALIIRPPEVDAVESRFPERRGIEFPQAIRGIGKIDRALFGQHEVIGA